MDSYRLYFIGSQRGRIESFQEFEAHDDAAAIQIAERLRGDRSMELWCRTRKLREWPELFDPQPEDSG